MWIIYKFEMPSSFQFWFDQGYKHSTLLPDDLKRIEAKLDMILNKEGVYSESRIICRERQEIESLIARNQYTLQLKQTPPDKPVQTNKYGIYLHPGAIRTSRSGTC